MSDLIKKLRKLSDLSKVKVGDTIWTIINGEEAVIFVGKIQGVNCVETLNSIYTPDGKCVIHDLFPSAFLKNPFNELDKQNNERWVKVSNDEVRWHKRKLIMIKNNRFLVWGGAETNEEVKKTVHIDNYIYCKEINEEIPQQIAIQELGKIYGLSYDEIVNILKKHKKN
jgi:hypothetical protein